MTSKLYSYTTGYCEPCRALVTARIVQQNKAVWLETLCPTHGNARTLVSTDPDWYEASREYVKPRQIPFGLWVDKFRGCPDSCGLCSQHRQHTCLPVAEITSDCNMECPVCLKTPGDEFGMTPEAFRHALSRLIEYEGSVPLLNLSGGEPTVHPRFPEFLRICKEMGVIQPSVSTNGLKLRADSEMRALFRETGTIVSLQFDGFHHDTWTRLRGGDFSGTKLELIRLLEEEGIRYSLVATLVKGVNLNEVAAIADFFFSSKALSLMFQPVTLTGAAPVHFDDTGRVTIDDVVRELCKSRHIKEGDFNPLPCAHPGCFTLSYYFQIAEDRFYSLKDFLGEEAFLDVVSNRSLPGLDRAGHEAIRSRIYDCWSAADSIADNQRVLARIKSILKELEGSKFSAQAAFDAGSTVLRSIFIHGFMDSRTFDIGRLMKCCNHYLQADGHLTPMCSLNVMGHPGSGHFRDSNASK
ncbi:MAG: radical SAM protein [Clostridiales Family XIII bacterium]|jgi:uncharacterized radical SAM superfamily Fe-S cluster-containing enzyme|nr:radical SAM protein [Clostridiales Family XIII bacterium]